MRWIPKNSFYFNIMWHEKKKKSFAYCKYKDLMKGHWLGDPKVFRIFETYQVSS